MASNPTVDSRRSPAIAWLLLVTGIAAAMGWVLIGQRIGDVITIADIGAALSLYYAELFLPLIGFALLLGMVGHQRVCRAGETPVRWMAIGTATGFGGLILTVAYAWLNGGLTRNPSDGIGIGLLLLGIALTLFQVFAEEILFRGWLQPALIDRIGVPASILLGAALFASFHLAGGGRAPLSLLNLALGGVWFGLLALRSGGILASIAAHFTWNVVEDLCLGLTPNPGTGPLGALTDLNLMGTSLWGSNEEGLNASIGTAIVLVALILPLLRETARAKTSGLA